MQANYQVQSNKYFADYQKVLVVSNYASINKISHYAFSGKDSFNITSNDVGMWRIKNN